MSSRKRRLSSESTGKKRRTAQSIDDIAERLDDIETAVTSGLDGIADCIREHDPNNLDITGAIEDVRDAIKDGTSHDDNGIIESRLETTNDNLDKLNDSVHGIKESLEKIASVLGVMYDHQRSF